MTRKRRRFRQLAQILAVVFVVYVFVIPQIGGARNALDTISSISPWLVLATLVLEAAALTAYGALTLTLLPDRYRPGLPLATAITVASTGINHVVPGGAATTAAVNYRLFGQAGVPATALGFALGAGAIGSAVVLNLILWGALAVSIPATGFHPLYATAATVGAVLILLLAAAVVGLLRGRDHLAHWLATLLGRLPGVEGDTIERGVHRIADEMAALASDRHRLIRATALAVANWLLDAAALWVSLLALGHQTGIVGLLVAYGLANVVGAIPITPGGLGVIEAVLIPTLIGFGNPASVVAVGVVAYRLVNFWLPIPVGAAIFLAVERHFSRRRSAGIGPAIDALVEQQDGRAS